MSPTGTGTAVLVPACQMSTAESSSNNGLQGQKKKFRSGSEAYPVMKNGQATLSSLLSNRFFIVSGRCEIRQSLSDLYECDSPQRGWRTSRVSDPELMKMNRTQSVPSKSSSLGPGGPSHKDALKVKRLVNREVTEMLQT